MQSRFAATLKVLGWMAFYLLLSAPAFFPAQASNVNAFIIRNTRVFDGQKQLNKRMSGSGTGKSRLWAKPSRCRRT